MTDSDLRPRRLSLIETSTLCNEQLAEQLPVGVTEAEAQILAFPRPRSGDHDTLPLAELTEAESITAADVLALVGRMKTRRDEIDDVVISMGSFFELPPISGDDMPFYATATPRERRAIEASRCLDPRTDGRTIAEQAARSLAAAGPHPSHLAPVIPIR